MLSTLITANDGYDKVLIAPLNWGLGHATRMIPVIRHCIDLGKSVAIASDGMSLELLKREFPALPFYDLPSYNITYGVSNTRFRLLAQGPKIAISAYKESKVTQTIVADFAPDLIISDNRLGVRHDDVKSIVVTHQVDVISPYKIFDVPTYRFNLSYLNKFDQVWIMDHEDLRLSGQLGSPRGLKDYAFLGALTRLEKPKFPIEIEREILVILSGPEPQRTLLEAILLESLTDLPYGFHLIRGTNQPLDSKYKNLQAQGLISDLVGTSKLNTLLNTSQIVISRTGYTSVIDLDALDKKSILIPTPGQTEQEYLGEHLQSHPLFTIMEQKDVKTEIGTVLKGLL